MVLIPSFTVYFAARAKEARNAVKLEEVQSINPDRWNEPDHKVLVCFLLVTSAMPVDASESGRNSGVREIQYDDSLDENKYRIFSSASIPTRSANLYAIDGVLFVINPQNGTNTAMNSFVNTRFTMKQKVYHLIRKSNGRYVIQFTSR